jgi:hypothetical protein
MALVGFSLSAIINYNFGDSETLMLLLAILGAAGAGERVWPDPDEPQRINN